MADETNRDLLALTTEIVSAHVANNRVHASELPALLTAVYGALSGLGAPAPTPAENKPEGAVSIRKSLASPDYLISMIDGRPYKALTRHLRKHGLDPKSYRERFGLPADYPMVSESYSQSRSAMAKAIGLGRKPEKVAAVKPLTEVSETPTQPKRGWWQRSGRGVDAS